MLLDHAQAFHTKGLHDVEIDRSRSGAEVWVQVRNGAGAAPVGRIESEQEILTVTMKPDWEPGSEQVVSTADGQSVSIVVPLDARPGSSIAVPVEAPGSGTSINWVRPLCTAPIDHSHTFSSWFYTIIDIKATNGLHWLPVIAL